ncbi:MAG: hypothetical protein ACLQQ4_06340 [Bacteroidia bacterium]
MKKLITFSGFFFSVLLLCIFAVSQSSCDKNTTCIANVYVVDTAGTMVGTYWSGTEYPVASATVKLWANISGSSNIGGSGAPTAVGTTDNTGHVQFSFQLPAILDITASGTVTVDSLGIPRPKTMAGTGLIQLTIGGTATQTVFIHQ